MLGAFYGGQAALFNYMSSEDLPLSWKAILTRKFWETFSVTKASKTILVGVAVGAISVGYGLVRPENWDIFTNYTGLPQIPLKLIVNFATTGVILGVDRLAKFIVRRTPLVRLWNDFKERVLKLLLTRDKIQAIIDEANKEPAFNRTSS